jgi:hypothetical protein
VLTPKEHDWVFPLLPEIKLTQDFVWFFLPKVLKGFYTWAGINENVASNLPTLWPYVLKNVFF